jgi:hypothetical protein
MKAAEQKLKKFKTRQVYGFKKETTSEAGRIDPTLTTSLLCIVPSHDRARV